MRVTVTHHIVRRGFILRTTYYEVQLTVFFSHEEKQVIQMRGLADTKLLDRRPATAKVDDRDEKFELRLGHLMDGRTDHFLCATPSKSKVYQEDILGVMEQVKKWIGDNTEMGDKIVVEL